ncbi:YheV family putative zinc ribbon protein [Kangiella sp. TOML190]|uniref:YheV family putative zinc ribbon protein n=1 Tax=Kangiella sp. TOML190 TaxID=2931351 RepID=UPI0020400200|nr:YheV family putative zinc ribbon protein [Kangiella sp. TOML190]
MSLRKQFIAGARCPKCSAMDSLVFYREEDVKGNSVRHIPVRECVDCGFKERLTDDETVADKQVKKGQPKATLNIKIKQL